MRKKTFDDVYIFTVIAKMGSFYEAAKYLRTSHSTLLKQMEGLESNLGVKLFYKNTKGIDLTSFGKSLYTQSTPLYDDIFNIVSDIKDKKNKPVNENKIKVLMSVGMAEHFLSQVYPKLLGSNDNFFIEINTYSPNQLESNISSFKKIMKFYDILVLDIAYHHILDVNNWTIVARNLSSYKLYASKFYVDQNKIPQKIDDLLTHNCIFLNHGDKNHWKFYDQNKNVYHLTVNGNISTDLISHVKELVVEGYGIGLLPSIYQMYRDDLVEILPEYKSNEFELCYFKNIQSKSPKTIDAFMTLLKPIYIKTRSIM